MSYWCHKYRPSSFDELDFHPELTKELIAVASNKDTPNFIFYGRPGSGKRTLIYLYLKKVYSGITLNWEPQRKEIPITHGNTDKKIEMLCRFNPAFVELNLSYLQPSLQTEIIQFFIKELADSSNFLDQIPYKTVVIHELDTLSTNCQQALRRILERNMETCRFIFTVSSLNRVSSPLQSRCVLLRVPVPSLEQQLSALHKIFKSEGVQISDKMCIQTIEYYDYNYAVVVSAIHISWIKGKPDTVEKPTWCIHIEKAIDRCMQTPTVDTVREEQETIYDCLIGCVNPQELFFYMYYYFVRKIPDFHTQTVFTSRVCEIDILLNEGSKPIYHIENLLFYITKTWKEWIQKQSTKELKAPELKKGKNAARAKIGSEGSVHTKRV